MRFPLCGINPFLPLPTRLFQLSLQLFLGLFGLLNFLSLGGSACCSRGGGVGQATGSQGKKKRDADDTQHGGFQREGRTVLLNIGDYELFPGKRGAGCLYSK
jgi:hypothetical protein